MVNQFFCITSPFGSFRGGDTSMGLELVLGAPGTMQCWGLAPYGGRLCAGTGPGEPPGVVRLQSPPPALTLHAGTRSLEMAYSGEEWHDCPRGLGCGGVLGEDAVGAPECPALRLPLEGRVFWKYSHLDASALVQAPKPLHGTRGEVTRATLHLDDECCSVNPFSVSNSTREADSEAVAPRGRTSVAAPLWGTGRMVDQLESNCFECTSSGPLAVRIRRSLRGPGPGRPSAPHLSWYLKGDRPCYIRFIGFE